MLGRHRFICVEYLRSSSDLDTIILIILNATRASFHSKLFCGILQLNQLPKGCVPQQNSRITNKQLQIQRRSHCQHFNSNAFTSKNSSSHQQIFRRSNSFIRLECKRPPSLNQLLKGISKNVYPMAGNSVIFYCLQTKIFTKTFASMFSSSFPLRKRENAKQEFPLTVKLSSS